eukprot:SAG11_NODE_6779_length_1250_cov_1.812337_1_plen_124_part_00
MRTIALLSFLSLWTEMAAESDSVHCADGELIAVATSGLARCAALREENDASARLGHSTVSSDFLPAVCLFLFFHPNCGGHLYEISGSVASCGAVSHLDESLTLFEFERHFISRCARSASLHTH